MNKNLLIILSLFYSFNALSGLIPLATRYDGAGSIYEAGYQAL